jgi:hypothetical protein
MGFVLFRSKEKAIEQAEKAIEMAKSENESYEETLRLLELMKEKK